MNIVPDIDDAPEFIAEINAILNGVLKMTAPQEFILIKIDGWFGPKWLAFSGKVIGVIPIWEDKLTIPPFVPNRVMTQHAFSGPDYKEELLRQPIHKKLESVFALQRQVASVVGNAALAWYSGDSLRNRRGSLMTYLPSGEEYWPWYANWDKGESWRIAQTKQITPEQLSTFQESGRRLFKS
jgi:hypothetical protein